MLYTATVKHCLQVRRALFQYSFTQVEIKVIIQIMQIVVSASVNFTHFSEDLKTIKLFRTEIVWDLSQQRL